MKVKIISSPKFAQGGDLTPEKAKTILQDGQIRGKNITAKQQRYFGFLASKAQNGTKLDSAQEQQFEQWRNQLPQQLQYTGNYDLRGLWLSNPNAQPSSNLHFPDTYKLPNHPTFSDESKYYNPQVNRDSSGHWNETDSSWNYVPFNMRYRKPVTEKKANGGQLEPTTQQGLSVENGQYQPISDDSILLTGDRHSDGGQIVDNGGNTVEAEGTEVVTNTPDGDMVVLGNLQVPGTNKKFKSVAKDLNEKQQEAQEYANKGTDLVLDNDPSDKWGMLAYNAGKVMLEGGKQKVDELKESKQTLADTQQAILDLAEENGLDPEDLSKGRITADENNEVTKKAQNGTNLSTDQIKQYASQAAQANGLDPNIYLNLIQAESSFNPKNVTKASTTNQNYSGLTQFSPEEAKNYGLTQQQLTSTNPQDIQAVLNAGAKHLSSLIQKHNGDVILGLAEYNGGQGAIDNAEKNLGSKSITGQQLMNYWDQKRQNNPSDSPSAWQNETYNYIKSITGGQDMDKFYNNYYSAQKPDLSYTDASTVTPAPITPAPAPTAPVSNTKPNISFDQYLKSQRTPNQLPSNVAPLNPLQILPEITALKNNTVAPVFQQNYNPQLYEPYQVSFQDRINEDNRQLNALKQNPYFANNPQALSTIAGQTYNANNQALADQFRTNQSIANDVTNKNISLINEANMKNLQLQDIAYQRQSQALSNTKAENNLLINSIINKVMQNNLENKQLSSLEPLTNYRYDANGNLVDMRGIPVSDYINFVNSQYTMPPPTTGKQSTNTNTTTTQTNYDKNGQKKGTTTTTKSSN